MNVVCYIFLDLLPFQITLLRFLFYYFCFYLSIHKYNKQILNRSKADLIQRKPQMSSKKEKGKMRLIYFLKCKSKRFLCHMGDKEIVEGKINFFFFICIFQENLDMSNIVTTDLIPSILLYLKRVYPQVYDIESG